MRRGTPVLRDLVLVGGGHSHVEVLRIFGMDPLPGVRVTVISREVQAPYSGMLPGLIAGHYDFDEAHIELHRLARFAGARFLHDEAVGIDLAGRTVACRDRPPVAWDVLSLDIGASPGLEPPGAAGSVIPVKPIDGFWEHWCALRDRCLVRREETRIGVVGAGAGGVELLLAVQHRLDRLLGQQGRSAAHLRFHLVSATDEILPSHNARVRDKFMRVLGERGVRLHPGRAVTRVIRADDVSATGRTADADAVGTGAAAPTPSSPAAARSSPAAGPGGDPVSARRLRLYRLELDGGGHLDVDEVLWVTTARAARWPGESGLRVDERGFVCVRDTLQALDHDEVFAAGDIAAVIDHPRPKAGVFAVRQGPPLAANLRARLLGEQPEPFRPQEKFLSLISTGDRYAVASRGEWAAEGPWVWRWKDHIDRRFMTRYQDLPQMEPEGRADEAVDARLIDDEAAAELSRAAAPELRHLPPGLSARERAIELIEAPAMRCGGCGAKVGATVLARVLQRLRPTARAGVIAGLEAADDAAIIEVPAGKQLVQTVDFFRDFLDDPFVFGQVAASHALADVFAMGAQPHTALATVTVPWGLEAKVEAELLQLLAGALEVLDADDTALVGGHTAEAAELGLGFAVTGLVDAGAALGKRGLRPGDALVLTKPLGTGVLFAAAMRGRARGRHIEAALASMIRSSRAAAACLREHGARAMTDVSGFGLIGHLLEMTRAAEVEVTMDLDALPVLDGACELLGEGMRSSLQPANERLRREVAADALVASRPAYALLFDPQTAGGLLAGVPGDHVGACVNALRSRGYGRAVAIGEVRERGGAQAAVRVVGGA